MSTELRKDRYRIKYAFDDAGQVFIKCIIEYMDVNGAILNPPITWTGADIDTVVTTLNDCCEPYFDSFTADNIPAIQAYNSISILKEECCEITVTTDAGTITLPNNVKEWCPDTFHCCLEDLTITGDCLDKVTVFLQRVRQG